MFRTSTNGAIQKPEFIVKSNAEPFYVWKFHKRHRLSALYPAMTQPLCINIRFNVTDRGQAFNAANNPI